MTTKHKSRGALNDTGYSTYTSEHLEELLISFFFYVPTHNTYVYSLALLLSVACLLCSVHDLDVIRLNYYKFEIVLHMYMPMDPYSFSSDVKSFTSVYLTRIIFESVITWCINATQPYDVWD